MTSMIRNKFIAAIGLAVLLGSSTFAQESRTIVGQPMEGPIGIVESVEQIQARTIPFMVPDDYIVQGSQENEWSPNKRPAPTALPGSTYPENAGGKNAPAMRVFGTIAQEFNSATLNDTGAAPPDTMADVGPTQILVALNGRVRVHDKNTGALGALNTSLSTFFQSVRAGQGTSDPRVRFDRITQRWFVSCITVAFPNRIVLAVSSGPTITGTSSFTFFGIDQSTVTPAGNTGQLLDYPGFGVDANAVYIGGNMFTSSSFAGCSFFVIRKSSVLGAGPMVISAFRNQPGIITAHGADNADPAATIGYFAGTSSQVFSRIVLFRVNSPGGTPTLTGPTNVTVPTTTNPFAWIPLGATRTVDALDERLMNVVIRPNPTTGTPTLWAAHSIETNSAGVGTTAGDRDSARWYEFQNLATTPTLRQSGTMLSGAEAINYTVPTINVNGQGHMIVAGTAGNTTRGMGAAYAGRFLTDPLGTTQVPAPLISTNTVFNRTDFGTPMRWGDYSMVSVDPDDNMTFWTAQMYTSATNIYAVRVFKILAPAPPASVTLAPATVDTGFSGNVVATGTSVNGTGFYDPGTGFVKRLTATVSGTGVTVNSVTFTSPTSVTLNITVAGGATVGARTVTITNPDGQTTTASLTINNPSNPVPVLTSLNPTNALTGSPDGTVTLTGSNFIPGSVARVGGSARATTFVNATTLNMTVTAADKLTAGPLSITVFNPAPGGGTSNALSFNVLGRTVTGTVALQNWGPGAAGQPVTVSIYQGATLLGTATPTLNASGQFSLSLAFGSGTYEVYVKASHWLQQVQSVTFGTNASVSASFSLINGDVDGDNEVGASDLSALSSAFLSVVGDSNFNAAADLDGDDEVGTSDLSILSTNFLLTGDSP